MLQPLALPIPALDAFGARALHHEALELIQLVDELVDTLRE
jgi:hypothetical protein